MDSARPVPNFSPIRARIAVAISAAADATYTVESSKLGFALSVDGVTLGGEALEGFEAFSLDFDLAKKHY